MGSIKRLYDRVQTLDVNNVAFDSLDSTSDEIARLNTEQLFEGKNANGEQVGTYRSELYAEQKNRMNPKPGFGNVDLRLTGDFYQRITTNVTGDSVITESTDSKAARLKEKYGDEIYGLNTIFRARFKRETLSPVFRRNITDITGLKFAQ